MSKNIFNRHVWLVDTISSAGECGISFDEIGHRWSRSSINDEEIVLTKRTFHYHKEAIAELFNLEIICDRRTNRYRIENFDSDGRADLRHWMLDSFAIGRLIGEANALSNRIMVDDIPSSRQFLATMVQAMRDGVRVSFDYRPFSTSQLSTVIAEPYFIKLRSQRWYLYAKESKLKTYALDRIEQCQPTGERFAMPVDFDARSYLRHTLGVAVYDEIKPLKITISATAEKAKYLDTLPLHHSQREVERTDHRVVYEYHLCPTYEFYTEILRQGEGLTILSPKNIRQEFQEKLTKIIKNYGTRN